MTKRYEQIAAAGTPAVMPQPPVSPEIQKSEIHKQLWGILIICGLILLVIASLFFFLKKKVYPLLQKRYLKKKGGLKGEKLMLRCFQIDELEKATNKFSEECLLGYGGFGNVYKGSFGLEGSLAIKRAHADSYLTAQEFRNEVRLLSKIRHRNLVALVGFCEESGAKGAKVLVYEYVPNGSLLDYIMGREGRSLTWRQRVKIAIGAAKGIAHLHDGVKPSIIHRDLKPSNILIGDGFEAKVSDFGLVKLGPVEDESHVSTQVKGTPGYLDPAYCSSLHLSPFSDVFSFGVILLQLVAARPAVDTTRNQTRYHIIEWARPSIEQGSIEEIMDANLLTQPCNMEMMLKMAQLGLKCVVKLPRDRPTMTQVWQELEEALNSVDNVIDNHNRSKSSRRTIDGSFRSVDRGSGRVIEQDYSQSFVSMNGVGFQRFHMDMESVSFRSGNLRCLEMDSMSFDDDDDDKRNK